METMSTMAHPTDPRTGRPLDSVGTLTDAELEQELTIAALTSKRTTRFETLLAERGRRLRASRA
jgi:hypothetical protein